MWNWLPIVRCFTFLSWLHLLRVVLAYLISNLEIFKSLQNNWHLVTDITSFEKILKVLHIIHSLSFYLHLVKYCSKHVSEGISHPAFYGDLVYKLRRVKCAANFVSSGPKIFKRLRRQKYDPVIIERTISLVLDPSTALHRSLLKHCTLTNKAVGTIWRDLS